MKVAILGGSGLIGQECVKQLCAEAAIDEVISVSRRSLGIGDGKLSERIDLAFDLPKLCHSLPVEHAICSFGTTMKQAKTREQFEAIDLQYPLLFARHLREQGVAHFHLVSSIGASKLSGNFYLKTKGRLEDEMGKLGFTSLHIYRPSLLLGQRTERRIGERLAGTVLGGMGPLFPSWLLNYRPIEAARVAEIIVGRILNGEQEGLHIWENNALHRGYQVPKKVKTSPFY